MPVELSYVLITPYTIKKSRTGGIIARLLSRTDLELVAAQMLSPSAELTKNYANSIEKTVNERHKNAGKVFKEYVLNNFGPTPEGKRQRVMMLLFRGENACEKLFSVIGNIHPDPMDPKQITGETIRDTYADLLFDAERKVQYFEPAVLTPPNVKTSLINLKMFSEFADKEPNILENVIDESEKRERTLVIIKPDNWRHPSTKPGNIIDMFSRTSLRIVGCKVHQMSVENALEFYGPVKDVLREKLAPAIGKRAQEILEAEFTIKLQDGADKKLTDIVGKDYADDQFSKIVEFMSGIRPEICPNNKVSEPGLAKCMILIYEGQDAIKKIRNVLGPTDPTKAPDGTIRKEFGHNVMINTAHASDAPASVEREMKIVKIKFNKLSSIIKEYLANVE